MRAPRSLLLILGGTALVVGAVLAFASYSVPLTDLIPELPGVKLGKRLDVPEVPCERPIVGAWSSGGSDGGWFNYAPNSSVTFSPGAHPPACVTSARWRLAGGIVLLVFGAGALVLWTRQSRLGVSASSPPPGEGSSDPTPGDPSPS
jgi:hypothetical protein